MEESSNASIPNGVRQSASLHDPYILDETMSVSSKFFIDDMK